MCARHVRVSEPVCPFCGAPFAVPAPAEVERGSLGFGILLTISLVSCDNDPPRAERASLLQATTDATTTDATTTDATTTDATTTDATTTDATTTDATTTDATTTDATTTDPTNADAGGSFYAGPAAVTTDNPTTDPTTASTTASTTESTTDSTTDSTSAASSEGTSGGESQDDGCGCVAGEEPPRGVGLTVLSLGLLGLERRRRRS